MKLDHSIGTALLLAVLCRGQQPNTPTASMTVGGANGPPFPIVTTAETGTTVQVLISGNPGAAYAILQSATGMLQTGASTVFGDKLDLPASPLPNVVLSGPGFVLSAAGQASAFATPPASAAGTNVAHQALLVDSTSPFGFSLSAATGASITLGPITTVLSVGDEGNHNVSAATLPMPFYGVNYTSIFINANGYMTLGVMQSDFTPSDTEFTNGPPRIAAFWTDLDATFGTVTLTHDSTATPSAPGYVRATFTNVPSWSVAVNHSFAMIIRSDGLVQITHGSNNNASIYDQITGIGPGNGLNPQPEKDLSGFLLPSSFAGGVNESFYQWFGLIASMPFYTQPDDPYDLFGRTLTFIPIGAGGLPGSTLRYLML